jgi:thiaminase
VALDPTDPARELASHTSSRLPRTTGARRELTASERTLARDAVKRCEKIFDESTFFRHLATGTLAPSRLKYMFGQYGHFRLQLHRWFGMCIVKAPNATDPVQREAIMALADHLFTDLRDNHDEMFRQFLEQLGFEGGRLHAEHFGAATEAYLHASLSDCSAATTSFVEALAALAGRELSVSLRNQRLLELYFAPRQLPAPTWLVLHAELEIDHFVDVVRPVLPEPDTVTSPALDRALDRSFMRHADYLDALLAECDTHAR